MGAWRRQGRNEWLAFVAAYALLFQVIFGAIVPPAAASSLQADFIGHVLCAVDAAERLPGDPAPARTHHLPDCCLVGCSLFTQAVLPARDVDGPSPPLRLAHVRFSIDEAEPRLPGGSGTAAKPRGPPFRL